ncbi:hypothetical protein G3R49_16395 [Shewanella sp. WXL01]|uniref:hypothetical protein n=1 Tax=Shewanella sp. WXL01 TaxID=2709721 RepID=UPI0014382FA0|nr:hypothetical protein [Shewanella sp. WXL01]NKF52145.1 hypothetical protein [Shewanella sp. WXL01]
MNSPTTPTSANVKRSRKTLIIVLAAFIVPVLAAKLVLYFDWYQGGVTNQGQLLDSNMSYQSMQMTNPAPQLWQMAYLLPEQCDQSCLSRLYVLNQTHVALGRHRDRVTPVIITTKRSDTKALSQFDVDFETVRASKDMTAHLTSNQFVIIDPLGSMVMQYPGVVGQQQNIALGKAMIADLRKMLKLSRVG